MTTRSVLLRAQVLVALWLPWALVALGPGIAVPIAALLLAGVIAFAALQTGVRHRWAIPLSAALSLLVPVVPYGAGRALATLATAILALAVSVAAVPSTRVASVTRGWTPWRTVVVGGLAAGSVVLGSTAAWSTVQEDKAYAEAQAQAAAAWADGPGLRARETPNGAVARLQFSRPGPTAGPLDGAVYVFSDIDDATLAKGPGWYPDTTRPGTIGNTAIAGHRTGYGSPFADLDQVRTGDRIVLTTADGRRQSYHVITVTTVTPDDTWVLGEDPLGIGQSMLTLTTCDPPHVNSGRLVVFAAQDASA